MKRFVTLSLTVFITTVGFLTAHNIVHHEDEPAAELPTGPAITPTTRPVNHAVVALTMGASAVSNVADGRHESGKLIATDGTGSATYHQSERRLELRAGSSRINGRSTWFALLGSKLTIQPGTTKHASAIVRIDGIAWHGSLRSDGGTAKIDITLQVQNEAGTILATTEIASEQRITTGTTDLDATDRSATAEVPLDGTGTTQTLNAYLYVNAEARGGSGATSVDFEPTPTAPRHGVSYDSIAIAIGKAPPPTTLPPAAAVPGQGITAAQLGQHTTDTSCWLLISGRVYDVTTFLPHHPGRGSTMAKYCGKDATEAFLTQDGRGTRHSYAAIDKMKPLYIGDYLG